MQQERERERERSDQRSKCTVQPSLSSQDSAVKRQRNKTLAMMHGDLFTISGKNPESFLPSCKGDS